METRYTNTGIGTGLGVAGIASAGIGAASSYGAASSQVGAEEQAAQLQHQDQEASLAFQQQEFNTQQENLAPWLQTGGQSLSKLSSLLGLSGDPSQQGFGSLAQGWNGSFTAPTAQQAQATPGYQFQLAQGDQAIQNSAAARGGLLSGGTAKSLDQYNSGLADSTYQQTYNNAFQQYQQQYNEFQQNQANEFNRYAGLAGVGQQAATTLGSEGQAAASNVAGINTAAGAQQGQTLGNIGAANASGYVGIGNAVSGGINNTSQLLLLSSLLGNSSGSVANGVDPASFGGA